MRLGRRGLLAGAGMALSGCATATQPGRARLSPSPPPSIGETLPPIPSPPPSHAPPPVSSAAPSPTAPSREQVVAEFTGRVPSQWGLEVQGVVLRSAAPAICLTFDACGGRHGSDVDEALIAALVDSGTPATLFLNSRWIDANPQSTRDLMADPLFELANHGTAHVPLSVTGRSAYGITGTASVGEVHDEVAENQAVLSSLLGEPPRFFRSGTAHYDDVAAQIVHAMGLVPVNFDTNTDAGATFTSAQVSAATATARAGSICIGHFNRPGSGTAAGIAAAIPVLTERGATFATLGDTLSG